VAVEELPGAGLSRSGGPATLTARTTWLVVFTLLGWTLVATMRYWWAWLWSAIGLVSVPVDTLVWTLAVILTILVTPVLWRWFRRVGVVVVVVGSVMVGGTAIVLSPWHAVFSQAVVHMECGQGDCSAPQPPVLSTWRLGVGTEKPK
jgi:hypothetical protein